MHLQPVCEKIRIYGSLAGRRFAGIACLVRMDFAEFDKRRIAHHERNSELAVFYRAPVPHGAIGIARHRMAIFVGTHRCSVQMRDKLPVRNGERESHIAVAVVAA